MPGRFRFRHILEVDQVAVGWQLVQWEFGMEFVAAAYSILCGRYVVVTSCDISNCYA